MVAPLDRRKLIAANRRLFYLIAVLLVAPKTAVFWRSLWPSTEEPG
jgi:hypothetical protein